MPKGPELQATLKKIVDEARALIKAAIDEVNAKHEAIKEAGEDHWYCTRLSDI